MTVDLSSFTCITRADFDTATLTSSYASMNGTGFSQDIKILRIVNYGTKPIDVSYNGSTANDWYTETVADAPISVMEINFQTNHADNASNGAGTLYGRKGQIIYGKLPTGGTAGTGILHIIGYR